MHIDQTPLMTSIAQLSALHSDVIKKKGLFNRSKWSLIFAARG